MSNTYGIERGVCNLSSEVASLKREVRRMNALSYASVCLMAEATGLTPDQAKEKVRGLMDDYSNIE